MMTEHKHFTCDGPDCDETTQHVTGPYATWIIATWPRPETPYSMTQYGLVQERRTLHFHRAACAEAFFHRVAEP